MRGFLGVGISKWADWWIDIACCSPGTLQWHCTSKSLLLFIMVLVVYTSLVLLQCVGIFSLRSVTCRLSATRLSYLSRYQPPFPFLPFPLEIVFFYGGGKLYADSLTSVSGRVLVLEQEMNFPDRFG